MWCRRRSGRPTRAGTGWSAEFSVAAVGGFSLNRLGVTAAADVTLSLNLASVAAPGLAGRPARRPHVAIGGVTASVAATLRNGVLADPELALALTGIAVGLGPGGTDSFLGSLLGPAGSAGVDVAASWKQSTGLRINRRDRPDHRRPDRAARGRPVTIRRLTLALGFTDEKLAIGVAGDILAKLGPLACTIEGVGVDAVVGPGAGGLGAATVRIGLRPPKGIGSPSRPARSAAAGTCSSTSTTPSTPASSSCHRQSST